MLIFLCCCLFWDVPAPAWVTHGCSCFAGVPVPTQPPLQPLLPKPVRYDQLRCEGHPKPVLEHSLEWCSPWVLALSQQAQPGALNCAGAAPSCSATSLSLHHTPLRHASTPRLVKACQNNPLNPQRKDLIKLFYSGIHAACWTVYLMTSSMTYECQFFSEAY